MTCSLDLFAVAEPEDQFAWVIPGPKSLQTAHSNIRMNIFVAPGLSERGNLQSWEGSLTIGCSRKGYLGALGFSERASPKGGKKSSPLWKHNTPQSPPHHRITI